MHYSWAIKIDFSKPQNQHIFWYRSEEKEEPRIGERYKEEGEEKEMKIDIARSVQKLYRVLIAMPNKRKTRLLVNFYFLTRNFPLKLKE